MGGKEGVRREAPLSDRDRLLQLHAARRACEVRIRMLLVVDRGGIVEIRAEREEARRLTREIERVTARLRKAGRWLAPSTTIGPHETSDVLVVSGWSGVGKTSFAEWLEKTYGWLRVNNDDRLTSPSPIQRAWAAFARWPEIAAAQNLAQLVSQLSYMEGRAVIEFGFPVECLFVVERMMALGFNCWWFDGDEPAAFACWKLAKNATTPESQGPYRAQALRVNAEWPSIAERYRQRIVRVLGPGSWHLPPEQIASLLGLVVSSVVTSGSNQSA